MPSPIPSPDLLSPPLRPTVTQADIVSMMRRIRFFHDAELQEDVLPTIAEWIEVRS